MINAIINILQQVSPPTGRDYGLCTIETDEDKAKTVVQYVGGGNGKRVEGPSFSYWRVTGPVKQVDVEDMTGCSNATKFTIPLRFVLCGDRETCGPTEISTAVRDMRARRVSKTIEQSLVAFSAKITSASIEIDPARGRTEIVDTPVPLHLSITYADITLEVVASSACLLECDPIEQNVPAY